MKEFKRYNTGRMRAVALCAQMSKAFVDQVPPGEEVRQCETR